MAAAAYYNYNWSELPGDLLVEISRRLKLYEDFVSFRGVCTSWRSAAVLENFGYKSSQIPWLMLPPPKEDRCKEGKDSICSFFSLSKGMSRHVILPQVNSARYFPSRGRLLKITADYRMILFHPFTGAQLQLPNLDTAVRNSIANTFVSNLKKCVLSDNSNSPQVMIIFGGTQRLACARPGDLDWNPINTWNSPFVDLIYCKDQFYAINLRHQIHAFNVDGGDDNIIGRQVAAAPEGLINMFIHYIYLVESDSDGVLWVVARKGGQFRECGDPLGYETWGFQVLEVNLSSNKWKEINNLGNRSIFLGFSSSLSIDTSNNPYCRPNCIYFTDDCISCYWMWDEEDKPIGEGGKDLGIYSLEDRSFHPLLKGQSCHLLNPPMWVEHSFQ